MVSSKVMKEEVTPVGQKISDYFLLIKMRLSFLVVFSATITFLYGTGSSFSWL